MAFCDIGEYRGFQLQNKGFGEGGEGSCRYADSAGLLDWVTLYPDSTAVRLICVHVVNGNPAEA
jgi:hypothetical protein